MHFFILVLRRYGLLQYIIQPLADYSDGRWTFPYFDCGGGNVWMVTYSAPILALNDQGTPVFKSVTFELQKLRPLSVSLSVCLFICRSVCQSVAACLSLFSLVRRCLSTCLFASLPVSLPVCLPPCLSASPSLPVFFFFFFFFFVRRPSSGLDVITLFRGLETEFSFS